MTPAHRMTTTSTKQTLKSNTLLKVPKAILRPVGKAISEFEMIKEGDRVLLGLSGGKDSLSLLHILQHLQRHAPINFSLAAPCSAAGPLTRPLIFFFSQLAAFFKDQTTGIKKMSREIEPGSQVSIIPPFVRNCSLRLVVRTLASHAGNRGSSPLGSTKHQRPQSSAAFVFPSRKSLKVFPPAPSDRH